MKHNIRMKTLSILLSFALVLSLLPSVGLTAYADNTCTVTFKANGRTVSKEVTLPHTFSCNYSSENGEFDLIIKELYQLDGGCCGLNPPTVSGSTNVTGGISGDNQYITVNAPFEGTATFDSVYFDSSKGYMDFEIHLEISCTGAVAAYSVTITPGSNMTKTSGEASQTGLSGPMTAVVYTANDGYKFPETSEAYTTTNGITVAVSQDQKTITVSGTPTADTSITIPDAVEELLTTITATGKEQANYSTANVATVSFSYTAGGSSAYLANWGWWGYGWTATVNAAEGYTITKCVFYDDANRTATDSSSPFVVETTEEDKTPRINGTPIDGGTSQSKGLKKIEVFGYATPAHTHDFTYTADGATITATCSADGCTLDDGTEQHNHAAFITLNAPESLTYDGSGKPVTVTFSNNFESLLPVFFDDPEITLDTIRGNICYYKNGDKTAEPSEDAIAIAGTHTAELSFKGQTAGVTYTIAKADPTCTAPTGLTATYGQTLADVTLTNPSGNTAGTWTWADSRTSVGNAGTNTFKASFVPTDTTNYNTKTNIDVIVTVGKANQTAPAAPTEAGKTINSITLNEISNGEYKCGAGDWQTSPTFTGLDQNKSYVFRQRYAADANHNASAGSEETVIRTSNHEHSFTYSSSNGTITATCNGAGTCNLTDNKVSFTLTAPAAGESGLVYDGTDKKATLEGVDAFNAATGLNVSADDIIYNDLTNVVTETKNAGTYQALYTLQTDFPRPFVGITFTIAKADPTYTAPTGVTATYGDTLADVALPDGWAWVDDTTSVGDAGTKTFKANFTPADTTNYNVVENVDVTVKVNPADITPTVTLEGWTYGDEANTPSVTGNAGNGDVAYTYAQKGSDNFSATVPTNAGNYTVKATIAATTNYNGATATADFTITKADPTYTVPTGLTATYGDTLADVTLPDGWTWTDDTQNVGNAGENTFKATFTPEDTDNYNIVENIDVSVTVGKAAGKDAAINTDTMTYNYSSIYIEGVAGQEYIIVPKGTTVDEMSWDNAVLPDPDRDNWVFFDNLTPATEYEIYTRTAETENSFAGEAVKANVYTTLSCIGWNYDSTLVGATITIEVEPETEGLTYKWYQDIITTDEEDREHHALTEIPDATGTSYTLREEDVGKYIAVKIFAGDSEVGDTVTTDPVALGATIVFDTMNGSGIETLTGIGYQAKITKPADPTRDGYAFGGWYKDAECTEAFDFDTPVTENITLYAKWTEISDGITYLRGDANLDGTVDIIDIVLIRAHIVNMQSLTGTNLIVADANADETVDIIDVAMIRDYIVKETPLDIVTIYD